MEEPVYETIAARRSIRTFADRPVEEQKIRKCVDAARRAPSWANKQCWHFVAVIGEGNVDALGIVPASIKGAQALVVACGDPNRSGRREGKDYYLVDVAIASEHMVLTAWEQGLGTCWVGAFKEDRVKELLGIPDGMRVVALFPIGYPADKEGVSARVLMKIVGSGNRKDLDEILHWGKW